MKFEGKTTLVTGANRGIGLEFVRQLLDKGNTVIATARQPAAADALQKLASTSDGRLLLTQLDVSDPSSISQWAADVKSKVQHLDLVVNNAGIMTGLQGVKDVKAEDMLENFQVNAIGPLLVTQQLHKQGLLGSRSGGDTLVANMTSKMGSVDDNGSGGAYAYRASKAALNIVNKSMSIDLAGEGVSCVLMHPGYVITEMTGGNGLIDTNTCVKGLLGVLEGDKELNGRWYDYSGKVVPW
ncbi:hypothetical protein D9Q98_005997 [Chlorella vulgaris]|uniref:C-factor n=1 Tax=Chlorella vulgaris TaxID=3077 RepID=A0A9D4TWZ8_CHLVU|nr:hypothetical protein D9Q98_005997 [Chlorella vulgaris]